MKRWGLTISILTMLILAISAGNATAQEAGMSDVEIVDERDPVESEKIVYTPGEDVRYVPKVSGSGAKDSVALFMHDFPMQQATLKSSEKSDDKQSAKSKDDSILTFNFLYYIIQKYKLQDIID